jgi:hypothetical protein
MDYYYVIYIVSCPCFHYPTYASASADVLEIISFMRKYQTNDVVA